MKPLFALTFILTFVTLNINGQEKLDTSRYYSDDIDFNLIIAAEKNYESEVKRLVEKGANVNAETWDGVTSLMYAVQNENLDIVEFLLEKGANPNKKPLNGVSPILAAIKTENLPLVELLIRNEANINIGDKDGITPLMYAAAFDNYTLADMLIYYNAWVNMQDNNGNTALMVASFFGFKDIVELLVNNEAQVNLADNKDFTPVYIASQNGYLEIVEYLYQHNANLSAPNKYGLTPLYSAVENKQYAISKFILAHNTGTDEFGKKHNNLMDIALETKNDSIIKLLKQNGYTVDYRPKPADVKITYGMHFTNKDAFAGGQLGFIDKKYNLNAEIGIYRRLNPMAVLLKYSDTEYYQYWEKRSMYIFNLGRYTYLYKSNLHNFVINPFLGYTLTSGRYRGTYKRPSEQSLFTPGAELIYYTEYFGLSFTYQYVDFKTFSLPDHRFGFTLFAKFPIDNNNRKSKKVIWYL